MEAKRQRIQSQLTRIVILVYVTTTLVALASVYLALGHKVQELGETFSTQYLLKERSVIAGPIEREVALARKMADTPIVRQWALDEENDLLREMALRELENYRRHFQDGSYFFIIDQSRNYYYNDGDSTRWEEHYRYTLDSNEADDQWYFNTMANTERYALNVNVDRVLETTKVWINVIVYDDDGQKIGLAGTGITLDAFLEEFTKSGSSYITPLLIDENGFIMAYEDADYIQLAALLRHQAASEKTVFELIGREQIEQVRAAMHQLQKDYATGARHVDASEEVATLQVTVGDEERIAALSYIPALDWYVVGLFDTSEFLSIWDFTPAMVVLLLAMLIIVVSIMAFIHYAIITPIHQLTDFSKQIAAKRYDYRLGLNSHNEFGLLVRSFHAMAEKIQDYTTTLEQQVAKRTEELEQTNAELAVTNQDLTDNINYASYLQQAVLPDQRLLDQALADHFVIWQPRDAVGGDFYWFKEREHQLLIAVVDCTGHGVPGALMTMTANAVLNHIVDTEHTSSPADILERYDQVMRETLREDTDEFQRDDGLDIALCAMDTSSGCITFAGAAMDLFYTDAINPEHIVRVKGDRRGIGYQRSNRSVTFTDQRISATAPTIYLTSDGFLDQNGGPMNKRYSRKRFMELLQRIQGQDLTTQGNMIKQELETHRGCKPLRDDITVVGFRWGI